MTHREQGCESCYHLVCSRDHCYSMILNSQPHNFATHPSDLVPNMVTKGPALSPDDPRVAKAVVLWKSAPALTVTQVMLATMFTEEDAFSARKRMWIRRRMEGGRKPSDRSLPSSTDHPSPADVDRPSTKEAISRKKKLPLHPAPKAKKKRKSIAAAQDARVAKKAADEHKKKAHKRATTLFAAEQKKAGRGLSAKAVQQIVLNDYEVCPTIRTIQRYVKLGLAGQSPMKMGPEGKVQRFVFATLSDAFSSMININQLNGSDSKNTRRVLQSRIAAFFDDEDVCSVRVMNNLLKATAIDLLASKGQTAEHRRIQWTTYNNIKTWFDNWEEALIELGFAERINGRAVIPEDQLSNIINMDETCLSLDGSNGVRGGRPEAVFWNPCLPRVGRATSKSAKTTTLITGSTGAGEALPAHMQFQTAAQSADTQRMRTETMEWIPKVRGKFGGDEVKDWSCTFGMNEKGGMDDEEFYKYIANSILPLYVNARDMPGYRVMIKADSGPGRTCPKLLTLLRHMGFILFPGVPNTTAVMQETDRNYGPFKTRFRINLVIIVDARIAAGVSTSLQPFLVGLCVFGGTDNLSNCNIPLSDSAFERAFSKKPVLVPGRRLELRH